MTIDFDRESMLEVYIFETAQMLEQFESLLLDSEKESSYIKTSINEIFRIMHTIKGSSTMMQFDGISTLSHSVEDLFYFIRENKPQSIDCSNLSDLMLNCVDFIKVELEKIKNGDPTDGNPSSLIENIEAFLSELKQDNSSCISADNDNKFSEHEQYNIIQNKTSYGKTTFKAVVYFEDDCEMENVRAYTIVHNLKDISGEYNYVPEDIIAESSAGIIKKQGFTVILKTDKNYNEIYEFFQKTIFLKNLELTQLENDIPFHEMVQKQQSISLVKGNEDKAVQSSFHQSIISVSVNKLDKLMDLVGELVISEAMVTQNPDLRGLELDSFQKATRQLRKIIGELQDTVMSIRMVPLAATLNKMHRIVRDMSRKLNKEVELEIIGEETEVDKNIIEHISDPLMHLIRNSIDHGIEIRAERQAKGKTEPAGIILEAKNAGGDVLVLVKDNGKGLDKEKILEKARQNGLLHRPENEMKDKEIYNLIFLPGFSTKDSVSEFSGRGVGMDVVTKNIEAIGGSISIDSIQEEGTTITLKIPLTLAIIDGMNIRVGKSLYTVPITSIKESFRSKGNDIFTDPDGNEMIMVRGQCYPVLRLYELYKVKTDIINIPDGIILMVENETKTLCIFADSLIGEQQVVVKALPNYIRKTKKIRGMTGCTLLGDGSISLILDIAGLVS